jgi:hypothetical protein
MDEENIINWNLKGPKRMKTRKELNALLKDKNKVKTNTSSTIELFKRTSSNDEFYFSGNKSIIRK